MPSWAEEMVAPVVFFQLFSYLSLSVFLMLLLIEPFPRVIPVSAHHFSIDTLMLSRYRK